MEYAKLLIQHLDENGDSDAAKKLRKAIDSRKVRKMSLAKAGASTQSGGNRLPVDGESRMPVADEENYDPGDVEVVLPPSTAKSVDRFIKCFKASDQLIANGVGVSSTMLIYGPPGTGKTQLARFISSQLGLPLIVARADGLISSYLGSTAKNLRLLFEHASGRPCALFLDEFDAIAKMRDDGRELGELKRVVISLLQNIDAIGRDHVLLAATNHDHLLDPAIWRRFAYKVKLDLPDAAARSSMLTIFLGGFADQTSVDIVASISDGMSGAQLRDIAEHCIRQAVLAGTTRINLVDLIQATASIGCHGSSDSLSTGDLVRMVHRHDPAITQTKLAEIFECSQSQISRYLSKQE
jgi:SpoVK/Ycf46/Vps4 family AAA+-type ATPase